MCQSLFFNKVADLRSATLLRRDLRSATLLKKRLWNFVKFVNFVKFLRTPFSQNTCGRLFLSDGFQS